MAKQYLVSVRSQKDMERVILYLENNGYKNPQNLTAENYAFPVLVVDDERFFGTNATCMAASVSCGKRVVSFNEWLKTI